MRDIRSNSENTEGRKITEIASTDPVKPTDEDKKKLSAEESVRKNIYDEDSARSEWKKEADEYRAKQYGNPKYSKLSDDDREMVNKKIEDRASWIENGKRGTYPREQKNNQEGTSDENTAESDINDTRSSRGRTREEIER